MIKIGAVTIDVSHPNAFSGELIKYNKDLQYTAVFNDGFRNRESLEAIASNRNMKIYDNLDEMIDNVDIGFVHACNWDKHLDYAMPFINKGKPVFIDKPLAGNTKDLKKFADLVKGGAKILGTSALRYCYEVQNIRREFEEKGIKAIHTVVTVGLDDFNYAIHAVEEICAIHHPAHAVSTRHIATSATSGETTHIYFVKFDDGSSAEYICTAPRFEKFNTIVTTTGDHEADKCFQIDTTTFYIAMLEQVELAMKGEDNLITTHERTEEAIRVMLAGKASLLNGDVEVEINSPLVDTVSFDGYEFETGYARAAGYTDYTATRK